MKWEMEKKETGEKMQKIEKRADLNQGSVVQFCKQYGTNPGI
jgi:hypothetical protein